jgi:hypothetical protein
MKKSVFTSALAILVLTLFTGCNFKYSAVEYNNRIVEQINGSSSLIEESAALYNKVIPNTMTEQIEIDTVGMNELFRQSSQALNSTKRLVNLESRKEEQALETQAGINTYIAAGDFYLSTYEKMLTYYSTDAYKEDISQVASLDETLHEHFTTFIEANNDLVEILEAFVE